METGDIMTGGGILAGVVAAFTAVKVGLYNKVSYGTHAQICDKVQGEIYANIKENHKETMAYLMKIQETLGELKGRK